MSSSAEAAREMERVERSMWDDLGSVMDIDGGNQPEVGAPAARAAAAAAAPSPPRHWLA